MTTKNKGTTPPLQTKAMLLATRRIANLTNAYVYSESARQDVVKAVLAKRPRSYGEINSPMNKYSYLFSYFAHFCSILLALPFIAHFLGVFVALIGYPTPPPSLMYAVAAVFLLVFEVGQSKTLNQTFDNFFNDGNYPIEAAIVATLFSIFSMVSSGYSAYYFLQEQTNFIWLGVCASLLLETLIIYCNFFRHRYQYRSRLEAEMLNDFSHNTNSNALFETFKKTPTKSLPVNYNQVSNKTAKIEIDEGAKNVGTKIIAPSKIELQKYGIFKQQTNPLRGTKTTQISTKKDLGSDIPEKPEKSVLTTLTADEGEKWTLKEIKNNIKSYEGKIRRYGKSFARVANLAFFKDYEKRFKSENQAGTMPKIEAIRRKKWYEENYPDLSQKLKQADKKK